MEIGLVVGWLVAFLLLGLAAVPAAAWLLPDTEYTAFAIPIALTVLAVVGHLVGRVAFGWPAVIAGLVVLLALSVYGADRTDSPDLWRASEHALVFVGGFLLVVVIRSVDPAAAPLPVAIGEKFLDFGLLNTLDRTGSLPPESMWFAGEAVRYHYGGHMLTSLLATLTGTDTAYAYNLALAGFYGTLLTATYGLAASIVRPYDVSRRLAGLLGVFFVGVAGNLATLVRLFVWQLPAGVGRWLVGTLGLDDALVDWSPDAFYYFDATRVVPVDPSDPDSFLAATEFPLFAWLHGDLHAHVMSQPFMLLAAGILLAAWRAPLAHRRRLLVGFLPPLVGLVAFLNVWSLPTVLGLTALGVAFSPDDPRALLPAALDPTDAGDHWAIEEASRLVVAAGVTAVAFVGGVLWTLPYWTTVVLAEGGDQSISYWDQWTPLGPVFVVFGAFLVAIAVYLVAAVVDDDRVPAAAIGGGAAVFLVSAVLGAPVLGLTIPLVAGGWWLARRTDAGFEALLVVAGAGLVLLVEFVTIEGERFNVVFKPFVHVWLFWAIATAVVLPRLASGWPAVDAIDRNQWRRLAAALAVVLVVATVPYAGMALYGHVTDGTETSEAVGPTLDATAFLEVHYPREAAAIRWLDDRPGQPTLVTAAPTSYWWDYDRQEGASAPATLTGLPTVAGWTHEAQYRGQEPYSQRVADVRTIYAGDPDRQAALLAAHDVEYVYVGPVERRQYDVTVDELDAVTVARSWEHVTIYEVDQAAVDDRT